MSIAVFLNAWLLTPAKGVDKLVLCEIANSANPQGIASVSIRDLIAATGVSDRKVKEAIANLRDMGELTLVSRGGARGNPAKYQVSKSYSESPPNMMRLTGPVLGVTDGPDQIASEVSIDPPRNHVCQPMSDAVVEVINFEEPDPVTHQEPVRETIDFGTDDVMQILDAAGVQIKESEPLFWYRADHISELREYLSGSNMRSTAELITAISNARRRNTSAANAVQKARSIRAILKAYQLQQGAL